MLRRHRTAQLQVQMANRDWAVERGLMFAREPDDCTTPGTKVGQAITALSERRFRRLIAAAGVRPIPPHGMRHTCASLLAEGVEPKTVADRLGHDVMMLMRVDAHVLGGQQEDAAALYRRPAASAVARPSRAATSRHGRRKTTRIGKARSGRIHSGF